MKTVSSTLVLAAALAAVVSAGKLHARPGFIPAEGRESMSHVVSPLPSSYLTEEDLPASYDIRLVLQGLGAQTPISRNQHIPHYCGSCWAHALTSSLSERFLMDRGGHFPEVDFAPQQLLDCNQENQACYGGDYMPALKYLHSTNVTDETCNRYVAQGWYKTGRTCDASSYCYTCSPNAGCAPVEDYPAYELAEYGFIQGGQKDTVQNMKAEIAARGTIMCSIAVTEAFENYTGGIFVDPTGATEAEHAITIAGYGTEGGKDYWIGRNSWGSWWGEDRGWFRFAMGVNTLGVESNGCAWGVMGKDPSPFPDPTGKAGPVDAADPIAAGKAKLRRNIEAMNRALGKAGKAATTSAASTHPMGFSAAHFDEDRSAERYELKLVKERSPALRSHKTCVKSTPGVKPSKIEGPQPYETMDSADLPAVWDWRAIIGDDGVLRNYLTAMRNQHSPVYCGSCWAQGTTSAWSDRLVIMNKMPAGTSPNISPQVVLNCGVPGSCDGGDPTGVYAWAVNNPIPDDTCQWYTATSLAGCKPINICETCHPSNSSFSPGTCEVVTKFPAWKVAQHGTISGVDAIKKEVYARGPVGAGVDASILLDYKSGIVKAAGQFIDHEVSITGWGQTPDGEEYWIVRNSWGEAWGERGMFYVSTTPGQDILISTSVDWAVPDPNPVMVDSGNNPWYH